MSTYIRIQSWHVVTRVDAAGWHTACGRVVNESARASDRLPLDEKSCETCLRLSAPADLPSDDIEAGR